MAKQQQLQREIPDSVTLHEEPVPDSVTLHEEPVPDSVTLQEEEEEPVPDLIPLQEEPAQVQEEVNTPVQQQQQEQNDTVQHQDVTISVLQKGNTGQMQQDVSDVGDLPAAKRTKLDVEKVLEALDLQNIDFDDYEFHVSN